MSRFISVAAIALYALLACERQESSPPLDSSSAGPTLDRLEPVQFRESDSAYVALPTAFTVSAAGDFYVSDGFAGRIAVFGRDGTLKRTYGKKGKGPGEFTTPGPLAVAGDSLLVAEDMGRHTVVLLSLVTGAQLERAAHPGVAYALHVASDTILLGAVDVRGRTGMASWSQRTDSLHTFADLPAEYITSPQLAAVHAFAAFASWADTLLLGYTGHPDLFRISRDGVVIDTVRVPAIRRRGVPADIAERFKRPMTPEEEAALSSVLIALHRGPQGVVAVHFDYTLQGSLPTARAFVSLLAPDLRRGCIDAPLEVSQDARPLVAFRGDTLFVLEQEIVADEKSVTRITPYVVSAAGCWRDLQPGSIAAR